MEFSPMPTLLLEDMKLGLWNKASNFRAEHATNRSFQKFVKQTIHHHTTEGSIPHN